MVDVAQQQKQEVFQCRPLTEKEIAKKIGLLLARVTSWHDRERARGLGAAGSARAWAWRGLAGSARARGLLEWHVGSRRF